MSTLKKTALWITLLAIVLKLSGFLRESIVAKQFGATHSTDGYLLAFSFITLVIALVSGGFNNVFLPMYVKENKESAEKAEQNANGVMNRIILLFLIISILGAIFAPYYVPFIYGSMNPETQVVATRITRFFFIFMIFIALSGVLDSYLQGRRIFVPSQISKLIATFMGAIFALLFSKQWGIYSLAYGFIFGTVVGTIIQFYYLLKSGYRWNSTLKVEKTFNKAFIVLIIPSLLNAAVGQVNMFVNKIFASGTVEGAVTYLNNASLIISIPNAIYGTTIAAIIFTLLSEQIDDKKKFQDTFFMGMEISLVTLLPISAALLVLGDATIAFIYQHGRFTAADTHSTFMALIYYLPMIVTQGLQFILSKSMFARGKTATVFRISVTTIVLNLALNFLLVKRFGYPGLAITTSVVSIYYFIVSAIVYYKDFDKHESRRLVSLFLRVLPPTIIMTLVIYLLKVFTPIEHMYSLFQLAILIPVGVIVYGLTLSVFYRQGLIRLINLVKSKRKAA